MKRLGNILVFIIMAILIGVFIYSAIHIFSWIGDNKKTDDLIKEVQEVKYEDLETKEEKIDFAKLMATNKETVGWIEIKDTRVNYPIVKHNNNSYYLFHSFDHSINDAGWIFLDYRNDFSKMKSNNIIYAHGRVDGSMFGSLKYLLNDDYYKNKDHKVYLYTLGKNYVFEVFSFYVVETTDDYLKVDFNDGEFTKFTKKLISRSRYNFNVGVAEDDKIITLSTCYNNREKLVLHAKLIEEE